MLCRFVSTLASVVDVKLYDELQEYVSVDVFFFSFALTYSAAA